MFAEIVKALISGAFICPHTMKEAYDYLGDEERRAEVEAYLARMDLRIAETVERSAFYATSTPQSDQAKRNVRQVFATLKNEVRPLVQFFMLAQTVSGPMMLTPGHVIPKTQFLDAVNENPNLRAELRMLASGMRGTSSENTNSALLDKVLRKMVELGYLHLVNREMEIYQVTGRIDYFHEVVAFLLEHEKIPEIEGDDNQPAFKGVQ
jgi:hypothetical protein